MSARRLQRARALAASSAGRVRAELGDGRVVEATLAFTFPYAPQPGDALLVLATDAGHDAIGLLGGADQARLAFPGEVELRCARGPLQLEASEAIELDAPRVTLAGGHLQTRLGTLRERVDEAYRWVQRQLDVRAERVQRRVSGEDYAQSENATLLAEETLKLDGRSVQLG